MNVSRSLQEALALYQRAKSIRDRIKARAEAEGGITVGKKTYFVRYIPVREYTVRAHERRILSHRI